MRGETAVIQCILAHGDLDIMLKAVTHVNNSKKALAVAMETIGPNCERHPIEHCGQCWRCVARTKIQSILSGDEDARNS